EQSVLRAAFLDTHVDRNRAARDNNYECPKCTNNSWIRYPSLFVQTVTGSAANISSIAMDQNEDNHSVPSDDDQEQEVVILAEDHGKICVRRLLF
ncbi:unnamed protein product, partial [Allacma fusca]